MKLIAIALALTLTACSTVVPVAVKFPAPPGREATVPCPDLQKLGDGAQLSDVARTVTMNYTTYYACAVKSDTWIEWYNSQRAIFEAAGK